MVICPRPQVCLVFMLLWPEDMPARPQPEAAQMRMIGPKEQELHRSIVAEPRKNRQFHASDLRRTIGQATYGARVLDVIRRFECPQFAATLAVHGPAVLSGEICSQLVEIMRALLFNQISVLFCIAIARNTAGNLQKSAKIECVGEARLKAPSQIIRQTQHLQQRSPPPQSPARGHRPERWRQAWRRR